MRLFAVREESDCQVRGAELFSSWRKLLFRQVQLMGFFMSLKHEITCTTVSGACATGTMSSSPAAVDKGTDRCFSLLGIKNANASSCISTCDCVPHHNNLLLCLPWCVCEHRHGGEKGLGELHLRPLAGLRRIGNVVYTAVLGPRGDMTYRTGPRSFGTGQHPEDHPNLMVRGGQHACGLTPLL